MGNRLARKMRRLSAELDGQVKEARKLDDAIRTILTELQDND